MKLRPEYLVVLAAVLLGAVGLGSGSMGAVLARTRPPFQATSNLSNWHGAGPGLALVLAPGKGNAPRTPPAVPAANAAQPYQVDTAPTISAAGIDAVLTQYHSPAVGSGQAFYDLGVKYGINPAVALAFFIHESSAGTQGVARVTYSIGNIRTTPGYRDYQGYRAYDSWAAGAEDWYKLIRDLYMDGWGLHTVAEILPRYAPSADNNDTNAYVSDVEQLLDSWHQ